MYLKGFGMKDSPILSKPKLIALVSSEKKSDPCFRTLFMPSSLLGISP